LPPIARAFLDIDARKGRLTTPVAAIFPARLAELLMKSLRDEFSKVPPYDCMIHLSIQAYKVEKMN
jgi:hypothetical protein